MQSHELDRLNQLRQAYLQRMTNKMKSKSLDSEGLAISPDRRELHFLEKNLEELSRAHKKVLTLCLGTKLRVWVEIYSGTSLAIVDTPNVP